MTPSKPVFVGVDIGAHSIQVATSTGHNQLLDLTGDWPYELSKLTGPRPIVALEPTGRHYSAPVVRVLDEEHALILQVDHSTTKRYRQAHVSSHKTDALDAQTLMLIARDHMTGGAIRGVKLLDVEAETLTVALRTTIDAYLKLDTERTRTLNRVKQIAYDVWPVLAAKLDTYLRAVEVGAISPRQLHELVISFDGPRSELPEQYRHGASRNALKRLVSELPIDTPMPPLFEQLIAEQVEHLAATDTRKENFEQRIDELIYQPAIAQTSTLWETVPASGSFTLASLHAATHCQVTTLTENQLSGVIGFFPQQFASGSSSTSSQKMFGYKPARRELHMWAMRLLNPANRPNPIADYNDRQKMRGHKYAFQATRAKLLAVLGGIARNGEPCRWNRTDVN